MEARAREPRCLDLTDAEGEWIGGRLDELMDFAQASGVANEYARVLTPEQLDQVWAVCLAALDPEQDDVNALVNAFGVGLGDWLVRRLDFVWKVAQDETTIQIAVLGQPGNMLVYPTDLVAKRYQAGETQFFADVAAEAECLVARARH
jgi:hypothetical protein